MNYPMFYCNYQTSDTMTILPCKLRKNILPIRVWCTNGDDVLNIIITDPSIIKQEVNVIILKIQVGNKRRNLKFFRFNELDNSIDMEYNFGEVTSLEDLCPSAVIIDYNTRKVNYIGNCEEYKETVRDFCTGKLHVSLVDCFLHPIIYSEP